VDEEEFDAWPGLRPFHTQDVKQIQRVAALGAALWGPAFDNLERQLRAPHPTIPIGYDLADFRSLQQQAQMTLNWFERKGPGYPQNPLRFLMDAKIMVGGESFTVPEACYEVVRRAIEFLERGSHSK
jgi:hypothetical protein